MKTLNAILSLIKLAEKQNPKKKNFKFELYPDGSGVVASNEIETSTFAFEWKTKPELHSIIKKNT